MIALFIIIYVLGIWLFYMKLKIKPRPTNIATAAVIGIVAVGWIVIFWRFASPMSSQLVVSRYTVQLVPQVKGHIAKIHAEPNVPLVKGKDILFEIQKDPYEYTLQQSKANVEAAKKNIEQFQAAVKAADAGIREAEAKKAVAEAELGVANETAKLNAAAISQLRITQLDEQYKAAVAKIAQLTASKEQSLAAVASAENTLKSSEAALETAQFNLDQCTVYAPADGFITNWQAREGTMAVSLPLAPVGMFVDTSRSTVVASFGQNIVKNVQPGDVVELAFKSRPGEIFKGKVESIIQASGEGQFVTSGQLMSAANIGSKGMFAVTFLLDEPEVANSMAMGTSGTVAVYTNRGKPFHIISKVTVRIKAWMYYLIPM